MLDHRLTTSPILPRDRLTITISIARPINGITLNPKEYALEDNDEVMLFPDVPAAKTYLESKGVTEQDINNSFISFEDEEGMPA